MCSNYLPRYLSYTKCWSVHFTVWKLGRFGKRTKERWKLLKCRFGEFELGRWVKKREGVNRIGERRAVLETIWKGKMNCLRHYMRRISTEGMIDGKSGGGSRKFQSVKKFEGRFEDDLKKGCHDRKRWRERP